MATIEPRSDFHARFGQQLPNTPEGMLELVGHMSEEELQELLSAMKQLEARLQESGPQDDDELHDWLKFELGIDIPRVAVCEDHNAPFDLLADLYFERIEAALGVANRGGAKTFHGRCAPLAQLALQARLRVMHIRGD
jgi:hypothetical protein